MSKSCLRRAAAAVAAIACSAPALAADCGSGAGGFGVWLNRFVDKAAAQGISQRAINAGLSGVSYDANVIRLDRNQKSFKLSFEAFYARRVGPALIAKGRRLMAQHAAVLDRIEQRFGVPREIIIAIWGLETNYGADGGGGKSIVRSLATLAYDCRRSPFFTGQLLDALRIIDRGDMSVAELRGGWAGEIGQTQFLPTPYVKYAVDFNGDGRRDLIHSTADVLASTANFLKAHGWKAGGSWEPGSANYGVIKDWNRAEVYQRTIAKMADNLSR
ncbi:MAG: lytic transglycosylase domain-containing protein [Hyphomicrobium sp.]